MMARTVRKGGRGKRGLTQTLTPRGLAVLRAFHDARRYAPGFVVSCGVLPELSESASERLHGIVREIADRHLDGDWHVHELQKKLRAALGSADADRVDRSLTELLATESTAAYLFGLAVGLAMHALPERLNRRAR